MLGLPSKEKLKKENVNSKIQVTFLKKSMLAVETFQNQLNSGRKMKRDEQTEVPNS